MYAPRKTPEKSGPIRPTDRSVSAKEKLAASNDDILQLEVMEDPADVGALEADWRALIEARPGYSYFQSLDYLFAAWECVASPRGRRLTLVVAKHYGRVVVIWPLVSFMDVHEANVLDDEGSAFPLHTRRVQWFVWDMLTYVFARAVP